MSKTTIQLFKKVIKKADGKGSFDTYFAKYGENFDKSIKVTLTEDTKDFIKHSKVEFPLTFDLLTGKEAGQEYGEDYYFICNQKDKDGEVVKDKDGKPYKKMVITHIDEVKHLDLPKEYLED